MDPHVFIALVLVALVVPFVAQTPANWGKDDSARLYDMRVDETVTWHPISGTWSLGAPQVGAPAASKWVSLSALFTNTLSLPGTSGSFPVDFRLLDEHGNVVEHETDSTGTYPSWSHGLALDHPTAIVLRKVPTGTYSLDIRILNEDGSAMSEVRQDLRLDVVHGGLVAP